MSRPKGNAEARLLKAGAALLEEGGLQALSVRGAARRAGVNLGLFHYHFKSRDQFARRLLQENYEAFFSTLSMESFGEAPPLERLRAALMVLGRFGRDHRKLFMALQQDACRGERVALEFAKANIPRHVGVLSCLIEECRRAGAIKPLAVPVLIPFLIGGVNIQFMAYTMLEKGGAAKPFGLSMARLADVWMSDRAIAERVDLLLGGVTARGRR
ncbi:MAG: TetR/AcrR family transcriptional regulator [Elusimicrobia bacterium]|nr:TetR/AcrR family transcriptional regulator [Elusimicrobiota bacterium]